MSATLASQALVARAGSPAACTDSLCGLGVTLTELLAATAGNLRAMQESLDDAARESFARWDESGTPPGAWCVGLFRFELGLILWNRPDVVEVSTHRLFAATPRPPGRPLASAVLARCRVRFIAPTGAIESLIDGPATPFVQDPSAAR